MNKSAQIKIENLRNFVGNDNEEINWMVEVKYIIAKFLQYIRG